MFCSVWSGSAPFANYPFTGLPTIMGYLTELRYYSQVNPLTHCRLNRLPYTIYWKSQISILGMSRVPVYLVPPVSCPWGQDTMWCLVQPPGLFCPRGQNTAATVSCPRGQNTVAAASCLSSCFSFFVCLCQFFCSVACVFFFQQARKSSFCDFLMEDQTFLFVKLNIHSSLKYTLKYCWLDMCNQGPRYCTHSILLPPLPPPPPPPPNTPHTHPSSLLFYFCLSMLFFYSISSVSLYGPRYHTQGILHPPPPPTPLLLFILLFVYAIFSVLFQVFSSVNRL